MSKYVMVDAVSMFRMRYVVEVPDDCENPSDPDRYPVTPEGYAKDSVVTGNTREFSQEHLDEVIVSTRQVTKEEAIEQFRIDNDYISSWSDEHIEKNAITEIGFDIDAFYEEEEKAWRQNIN